MIILAEFVEVFTPFMYGETVACAPPRCRARLPVDYGATTLLPGVFMVFAYHGWNRQSFVRCVRRASCPRASAGLVRCPRLTPAATCVLPPACLTVSQT